MKPVERSFYFSIITVLLYKLTGSFLTTVLIALGICAITMLGYVFAESITKHSKEQETDQL